MTPVPILRNHYVLAVHDLERTSQWYGDVLGCTREDMANGEWAFLHCGDVTFMCGRCPNAIPAAELGDHSYFAYIVVEDVDAVRERAAAADAEVIKPVTDESWGMREFGLRTCDGHRMMFGQRLEAEK